MRREYKNLFKGVALLSLLFLSFFIYQSYTSYRSYNIFKNSDKYIAYLYKTNKLLRDIEDERFVSAYYLGSDGDIGFDSIKDVRKKSDLTLKSIKNIAKRYPQLNDDLEYARSKVDVISQDHNNIIFDYYQHKIVDTILKDLKIELDEFSIGVDVVKSDLNKILWLLKTRDMLNQRDSFFIYLVSQNKKAGDDDLVILDRLFKKMALKEKLNIKKPINLEKSIILGALTGDFKVKSEKLELMNDSNQNMLNDLIKKKIASIEKKTKELSISPRELIKDILMAFLAFVILLFSLKIIFSKTKKRVIAKKEISPSPQIDLDVVLKYKNPKPTKVYTISDELNFAKTAVRSFNPLEKFESMVSKISNECDIRDIGFKHKIDSDIPTHAIGNVSKIDEVLKLFADFILDSTTSLDLIDLNIENIAKNGTKDAIKISINKTNTDISSIQTDDITIMKIKKLLSLIDGSFKIENEFEDGVRFLVILNLERI